MSHRKRTTKQEQLRELLNRQAKALSEEAVGAGGEISADKLGALERLKRLADMQPPVIPPRRIHWPVIILLAVTLSVVSILLFSRVRTTEIELDLSLSEVGFRLPKQQVFAEMMKLSAVGISGVEQIQLPQIVMDTDPAMQAYADSASSILLTSDSIAQQKGTITLATLAPPAETRIWIRPTEIPSQYRLSINAKKSITIEADLIGPVQIGLPGVPNKLLNVKIPKSITMESGSQILDMDIHFLHSSKDAFSKQLIADSLNFFRIDEHFDQDKALVRRASTILGGSIYFESLGGKEQKLRPGEEISFDMSTGEIRTLELAGDHISFAFHGRVQGMTSGVEEHRYSIMPTYLEWLTARHGLSLLWGTTIYLFGLILTVWRWWRNQNEI